MEGIMLEIDKTPLFAKKKKKRLAAAKEDVQDGP